MAVEGQAVNEDVVGHVVGVVAGEGGGGHGGGGDVDAAEGDAAVDAPAGAARGVFGNVEHMAAHEGGQVVAGGVLFKIVPVGGLQAGTLGDGLVFHPDVLKEHVVDVGVVYVLYVHGDVGVVDQVAAAEGDAADVPGPGLRAELQGASPVTPDDAVFHQHILEGVVEYAAMEHVRFVLGVVKALDADGVVEGADEENAAAEIEAFFKANSDKLGAFYSGRIKIREMYKSLVPQSESEEDAVGVTEQSRRSTGKERVAQMQEEKEKASFLQGGVFGKTTRNRKVDDPFENSPRCVKDAIETFDSSLVEMNGYIDANTLSLRATLKFSSPANAARFKDAYVKIYGEVIPSGFENVQLLLDLLAAQYETKEEMAADNYPLYTVVTFKMLPVLREFLCGEAICHQPRQSDSEIILEESVLAEVKKLGPNTIGFASFVGALFVPEAKMFLAPEQSSSATPSSPSSPKPARPRATSSNGSYAPDEGDLDSVFEEEDAASDGQEKGDGGNPFKEVEPSEGADSSDSNGENPFKEVESSEGADSGDDNPFKEVDG